MNFCVFDVEGFTVHQTVDIRVTNHTALGINISQDKQLMCAEEYANLIALGYYTVSASYNCSSALGGEEGAAASSFLGDAGHISVQSWSVWT